MSWIVRRSGNAHRATITRSLLTGLSVVLILAGCQTDSSVRQVDETVEQQAIMVRQPDTSDIDLDGSTVRGEVVVSIPAEGWMKEVRFFLNGTLIQTLRSGPFEVRVDTTTLTDGAHSIGVEARMANGRVRTSTVVEFSVLNGEPAPEPSDPEPSDPEPSDPGSSDPQPSDPEPSNPDPWPDTDPTVNTSLRGDPGFAVSQLNTQQRVWYDRMNAAIAASASSMISRVEAGDMYRYGRTLYQYNSALLMALRATGDLRFLDHVDTIAQGLRHQLYDGWCGDVTTTMYVNARYGTVSSPDGYLNFRRTASDSGVHWCRDTGDLEDALVHGHLALLMYAYHVNRDLPSPTGVDYGERADFWLDYLRNHFEAKWRARSKTAWPAMDFMDLKFCHTYSQMTLYYYFVGKRLQSDGHPHADAYLQHVTTLTDAMFDLPYVPGKHPGGFVDTTGAYGDAVIYSFGAPSRNTVSSTHLEACPTTYARYAVTSITNLRLENVARWDDVIMTKLANGLNSYVFDINTITRSSDTIAAGVSGSTTVEGMPPTEYRSRLTAGAYHESLYSALSIWDHSGRIENLSLQIYNAIERSPDRPNNIYLPSSMLFIETATRHALGATAERASSRSP